MSLKRNTATQHLSRVWGCKEVWNFLGYQETRDHERSLGPRIAVLGHGRVIVGDAPGELRILVYYLYESMI